MTYSSLTQASGDTPCHCAAGVRQGWSLSVSTACQGHFRSPQMVAQLPEHPDQEKREKKEGEKELDVFLLVHWKHPYRDQEIIHLLGCAAKTLSKSKALKPTTHKGESLFCFLQ